MLQQDRTPAQVKLVERSRATAELLGVLIIIAAAATVAWQLAAVVVGLALIAGSWAAGR